MEGQYNSDTKELRLNRVGRNNLGGYNLMRTHVVGNEQTKEFTLRMIRGDDTSNMPHMTSLVAAGSADESSKEIYRRCIKNSPYIAKVDYITMWNENDIPSKDSAWDTKLNF